MVQRNQTAEDSSPLIKWVPANQWIDGSPADSELPKYSAGSFRLTTTNSAYASFSFNGTGVWIYGAKRFNHGPYRCNVDGNDRPIQDGYSDPANNQISVPLCSAPNLRMGNHTITITNLWTDANLPYLDVDYIIWETKISEQATLPSVVFDDADTSNIQYTPPGEWSPNACTNMAAYSSGSCHVTGSNTAKATVTFEGDAIAIYGGVGPQYGPYAVKLDGQPAALFTANSTNSHAQQILYFASGLGAGNHTVVINNNPASIGNQLDIDYVQVLGGGIPQTGNSTTGGDNNGGGSSKVGPIVGAVVGVIGLIAIIVAAWFFWRRRKQSQEREKIDLGENDKSDSNVAMAHALPTPYVVPGTGNGSSAALYDQGNNMSTHSVSMPQPQPAFYDNNNGARPYTGYGTQYTLSEGYPETPVGDTFAASTSSPGHRPQHSSAAYTAGGNLTVTSGSSSNGDGSSRGPSTSHGVSPAGAVAPGPAVGEKGANLYVGPTVRNDSEQVVDAPPSYTR